MAYPNYYQGGYYPQYQNGAVPDMLNQYKGQYQQMPMQQPMMQQPVQQMPMQNVPQTTPSNDMIWVLSEVEAQSYPVAPNNSVILWDKNNDVIYIKSANMQGVPSMRILDYTERTSENTSKTPDKHACQCDNDFVRKEQFEALQGEIASLRGELDEIKSAKEKTKKRLVEEEIDNG